MKKELLVFLLLISTASAYTISDYPSFFVQDSKFKALYVIGEESPSLDVVSATVISAALAKYPNVTTEIGTSRIDSEIADIKKENAIVIGSPCENKAAAQLEGNPVPCDKNLIGSTGYLKLYENNGKTQLLITGISAEDRHQAAKFLAGKSLLSLETKEFIVPTTTNSMPANNTKTANQTKTTSSSKSVAQPLTANQQPQTTNHEPPQTTNDKLQTTNQPIGDYESLEELPPKKNVFVRFWNWLMRLF